MRYEVVNCIWPHRNQLFFPFPLPPAARQHFSPMQSPMPVAHITLTCLIEGDSSPFFVEPKKDNHIMELKDFIHEKGINPTEHAFLAKDLLLWKVRMIMGVTSQLTPLQVDLVDPPEDTLSTLTGKNVVNSVKLKAFDKVLDYVETERPEPHVKLPDSYICT